MKATDVLIALNDIDERYVAEAAPMIRSEKASAKERDLSADAVRPAATLSRRVFAWSMAVLALLLCTAVAVGIAAARQTVRAAKPAEAASDETGWQFAELEPLTADELKEQYGLADAVAAEYAGLPLLEVRASLPAYPIGEELEAKWLDKLPQTAGPDGRSQWLVPAPSRAELEAETNMHPLSLNPDASSDESLSVWRAGDGLAAAYQWWETGFDPEREDRALSYSLFATACICTEPATGQADELKEVVPLDGVVRGTRHIEALDTDVTLLYKHSLIRTDNDPSQSNHHNVVLAWYIYDGIAYRMMFSLQFGEALTPDDAFDLAATLIGRMQ